MHALKLYGPRTGRQNSDGTALGPYGSGEWTYDFLSKTAREQSENSPYGPGSVMWLGITSWISRDRVTIVWSLWRHQRSFVASSGEGKPSEWETLTICKDRCFLSFMDSFCRVMNKIMPVFSWRTVSALTRVLLWCLFPSLLRNSGNKHENNPLVSA